MAAGKWQLWTEPDQLERITNWAANGLTNAEMAASMGIHRDTLRVWIASHPAISDAIKKGRLLACEVVENALFRRATGMTLTETVTTEEFDGAIVDGKPANGSIRKQERTTTRQVPPDTGAIIFYLKNRMPDKYADRRETKVDVSAPTIALGVDPARAEE